MLRISEKKAEKAVSEQKEAIEAEKRRRESAKAATEAKREAQVGFVRKCLFLFYRFGKCVKLPMNVVSKRLRIKRQSRLYFALFFA
jgi:hypothetical protein